MRKRSLSAFSSAVNREPTGVNHRISPATPRSRNQSRHPARMVTPMLKTIEIEY